MTLIFIKLTNLYILVIFNGIDWFFVCFNRTDDFSQTFAVFIQIKMHFLFELKNISNFCLLLAKFCPQFHNQRSLPLKLIYSLKTIRWFNFLHILFVNFLIFKSSFTSFSFLLCVTKFRNIKRFWILNQKQKSFKIIFVSFLLFNC